MRFQLSSHPCQLHGADEPAGIELTCGQTGRCYPRPLSNPDQRFSHPCASRLDPLPAVRTCVDVNGRRATIFSASPILMPCKGMLNRSEFMLPGVPRVSILRPGAGPGFAAPALLQIPARSSSDLHQYRRRSRRNPEVSIRWPAIRIFRCSNDQFPGIRNRHLRRD